MNEWIAVLLSLSSRSSLLVSLHLSLLFWFPLFSKAVTSVPNGCVGKLWLHWFSGDLSSAWRPHSKTWVIGLQNILIKTLSDWLQTAENGLLRQGEAAVTLLDMTTNSEAACSLQLDRVNLKMITCFCAIYSLPLQHWKIHLWVHLYKCTGRNQ